jgi:tetratricopeptide (TPR) repeat protein
MDLLKGKLPFDKSDPKDFENLADALEHIPLAIIQACGYITAKGGMFGTMSVRKYLNSFKHSAVRQAELLSNGAGNLRRDPEVPSSVIAALQLSFEQIHLQYRQAALLLPIMAQLDRQGMSRDLLLHFGLSPETIDEALGTLVAFALITVQYSSTDQEIYGMHRLVQLSVMSWYSQMGNLGNIQAAVLKDVYMVFPWSYEKTDSISRESWEQSEDMVPHVITLAKASVDGDEALKIQGALRLNLASYMNARGECGEALQVLNRSPRLDSFWDTKDLLTAVGLLKVTILTDMYDYDAAETLVRALRDDLVGYCDPQDKLFLSTTNTLATCLVRQHKFEQAEYFLRGIVAALEERSSSEDVFYLDILQSLALISTYQEKWDEADKIYDLVRTKFEPVMGATNPRILRLKNDQALGLYCQGRYPQSSEAFKTIHMEYERIFAPQQPEAIGILLNLTQSLQQERRFAESVPYLRHGLAWCFGQDVHGKVISMCMFRFALALTYLHSPGADEAWAKLGEMCLSKDSGVKFIEMASKFIDQADEQFANGDYSLAEDMYKEIIQILLHLSSPDDPRLQAQRERVRECRRLLAKETSAMDGTGSVLVESASK